MLVEDSRCDSPGARFAHLVFMMRRESFADSGFLVIRSRHICRTALPDFAPRRSKAPTQRRIARCSGQCTITIRTAWRSVPRPRLASACFNCVLRAAGNCPIALKSTMTPAGHAACLCHVTKTRQRAQYRVNLIFGSARAPASALRSTTASSAPESPAPANLRPSPRPATFHLATDLPKAPNLAVIASCASASATLRPRPVGASAHPDPNLHRRPRLAPPLATPVDQKSGGPWASTASTNKSAALEPWPQLALAQFWGSFSHFLKSRVQPPSEARQSLRRHVILSAVNPWPKNKFH